MDFFELNKVLGALLGSSFVMLTLNIATNALFAVHKPDKAGYEIAVQEQATAAKPGEPAAADDPLPARLASADVGRGEASAKKCAACHTFDKGGRDLVGPNLWNIVGRAKAANPAFNYSAAMRGQKGNWTLEDLDAYVKNPRGMVPGTNMSFAGIPRAGERADLVAYLNAKADNPAPLPKAAELALPSTRHALAPSVAGRLQAPEAR